MVAIVMPVVMAILALASFPASTIAQPAGPATTRAPDIHPATGLKFPSAVGADIRLLRSIDYGKSEGRPEFGYSLNYAVAPLLDAIIWVNVFNGGLATIPTGPGSTLLAEQFDQLLEDIRQLPPADGQKIVKGPAECLLGGMAFRCATLQAVTPKTHVPINSTLSVTGYRDHFLSIWLEWEGKQADPATVQAYLDALVGAMTR